MNSLMISKLRHILELPRTLGATVFKILIFPSLVSFKVPQCVVWSTTFHAHKIFITRIFIVSLRVSPMICLAEGHMVTKLTYIFARLWMPSFMLSKRWGWWKALSTCWANKCLSSEKHWNCISYATDLEMMWPMFFMFRWGASKDWNMSQIKYRLSSVNQNLTNIH